MVQVSLITIAVILAALAIFVLRSRFNSPSHRFFAAFAVSVAGWTLGVAGLQQEANLEAWGRFAFACASLIPATSLAFVYHYPGPTLWLPNVLIRLTLLIALGFAVFSLTTPWIAHENSITPTGLTRKSGPLYLAFATYFLITWGLTLALLTAKWIRARGLSKAQLQYVGTAFVLSGTGAITANLLLPLSTGRSTYSWIGPYFGLILIALISHAIIRHRLMDLRLVVHRSLTMALALTLSVLPIVILLAVSWPALATRIRPDELLVFITITIAVAFLVPPTRDIAQRLLDRYVYRTQANYQRTVREASQVLTRVLNLDALLAFLSHTVATSTQAEGVAVYLRDEQGLRRAIVDTRHQGSDFAAPERTPVEVRALLEAFREPLVAEEIARAPAAAGLGAAADQLARANWSLLLPVLSEDTVIGAIVLGPKLSGDPYYPQDLDLLMTLANQAGVAIKNAQLYAQVVLANEYIENIVATIESGVIAINSSGHIAMFNRAAARLTGLSEADVTGRPVGVLPARLAATLVGTVTDGQARTHPEIDLPAVAPADEPLTRPVICTTSPLRDETGAVLGAVAVFSDLTPVKELEIERRRAERLAYFEVLASGIAHEIKNPLVAIKTFAQLLPRRLGDDRFIDDFGRIVTREVTRMERLGERLRALARPGERPRHLLDLRAPLTEALEFLQSSFDEKGITVRASLGDTACSILGDRGELEQLFLNLLMNAHEATPPGGAVLVELTRTEAHVTIAVADTGPGIPPELLERVFEPFFTTKQRGTGLGLAIGAGIAQAHGARLRAANRPAGGALLTVDFPVTATVPTPVTA